MMAIAWPIVRIPRGTVSFMDIIWLLPTMVHLSWVLFRPVFVKWAAIHLPGWSPAALNHLWGFIVQFCMVGFWGGDAFNIAGLLVRSELGWSRFPKMALQFCSILLVPILAEAAFGSKFVDDHIAANVPTVKVCGYETGKSASCQMEFCGIWEGIAGTCIPSKGCCLEPTHIVLDEIRHVFWFPFFMRMLGPAIAPVQPLGAAVFQLAVRLFPSCMTGSWVNPSPHILRAYISGDWSYIHLILLGTCGAQFAAMFAANAVKYVMSLFSGDAKAPIKANDRKKTDGDGDSGKASKAKADVAKGGATKRK